jgi:hypothetical protein
MRNCNTRGEAGAALVTTLLATALLVLIATIASQQAVISFLVGHRMRESAEALVAAETGVAAMLADLARQPSFERLSRAAGGGFPFSSGAPSPQPLPNSFTVETEVRSRSASILDIVATAAGRNQARRIVVATVQRGDQPYAPAALYLAAAATSLSFTGTLEIAGAGSAADDVAAVATALPADAEAIEHSLIAGGAALDGAVAAAAWDDLGDVVQRIRDGAAALPEPPQGTVAAGMWASRGPLDVDSAAGSGVWLIDGDLTVHSALSFAGVLLVLGDIHFADGAEVTVDGAVVQAAPGRSIVSRGRTTFAYDGAALRAVDSAHPSLLEHRLTVIGWRDYDP